MTDSKDLVKRLRADMTGIGCDWLPLMREAADLIEALTKERYEARAAEHRYLQDGSALTVRAETAESQVAALKEALTMVIEEHGYGLPADTITVLTRALEAKP
jgi:hypothetical protein